MVKETRPVAVRRVLEPGHRRHADRAPEGRGHRTGTGKQAAIPGYVVAGKTGTAQKVDATGRYSMVDHVASFVGFVPASRPALVVLVSLDTPRGARNQGGDVAAPLFARIAEQALRHLAVPPDDPDAQRCAWSTYRAGLGRCPRRSDASAADSRRRRPPRRRRRARR